MRDRLINLVGLPVLGLIALFSSRWSARFLHAHLPVRYWNGLHGWAADIVPFASSQVQPWAHLVFGSFVVLFAALQVGVVYVWVVLVPAASSKLPLIATRLIRFVTLWVGITAAGTIAVLASQLGGVVYEMSLFGGRGGSYIKMFAVPAVWGALRWSATWGLLVAVVAVFAAPACKRFGHIGSIVLAATLVLAVGASAVTLVWASVGGRYADSKPAPKPSSTQTGTPSRPPPTDRPPLVNPSSAPSYADRCQDNQLLLRFGPGDAAAGSRWAPLSAENVSNRACVLWGLPDFAFADANGNAVRPALIPTAESAAATPVALPPGQTAYAGLAWLGDAPAGSRTVEHVLAAPWAGAQRTDVQEYMDVRDGSRVFVMPWSDKPTSTWPYPQFSTEPPPSPTPTK